MKRPKKRKNIKWKDSPARVCVPVVVTKKRKVKKDLIGGEL